MDGFALEVKPIPAEEEVEGRFGEAVALESVYTADQLADDLEKRYIFIRRQQLLQEDGEGIGGAQRSDGLQEEDYRPDEDVFKPSIVEHGAVTTLKTAVGVRCLLAVGRRRRSWDIGMKWLPLL